MLLGITPSPLHLPCFEQCDELLGIGNQAINLGLYQALYSAVSLLISTGLCADAVTAEALLVAGAVAALLAAGATSVLLGFCSVFGKPSTVMQISWGNIDKAKSTAQHKILKINTKNNKKIMTILRIACKMRIVINIYLLLIVLRSLGQKNAPHQRGSEVLGWAK